MSPLLPMKETSREVVMKVTRALQPYLPEITAAWRQRMFAEFNLNGRAMTALEGLTVGVGFSICSQTDFAAFYGNLQHFGRRLAKLKVDARVVGRSLEIYQQLIDPYLQKVFPAARLAEALAAMEALSWVSYVAVSAAYLDARKTESAALVSVLEAGQSASTLDARVCDARMRPRISTLTPRENEILKLLAQGYSVKEIAALLGLSVKTIEAHKFNLMRKLDIHNKAQLVTYAIQKRIIKIPVNQ
jgi:DNA-binding CsgD family transcriptional regulator